MEEQKSKYGWLGDRMQENGGALLSATPLSDCRRKTECTAFFTPYLRAKSKSQSRPPKQVEQPPPTIHRAIRLNEKLNKIAKRKKKFRNKISPLSTIHTRMCVLFNKLSKFRRRKGEVQKIAHPGHADPHVGHLVEQKLGDNTLRTARAARVWEWGKIKYKKIIN